MNTSEFAIKYADKGGLETLERLRKFCYSRNYIGKHFGVTSNAVTLWYWMFYDGQEDLSVPENEVMANMIEFAKNHELKEFRFAFKGNECYKTVLSKVIKEVYGSNSK